ncbi:MAG: methyltransferase domain-containing protein [Faecalibacterium sp.]|nr:methyltransferase domain-containing protein [Faecalibacterium sp.]
MSEPMLWRCPLCGGALTVQPAGGLRCEKNHCFDRAKEGYWNLLPVQAKHAKQPGDTKEMVAARRAFLSAGYYAPFGRALAELCLNAPARGEVLHLLDAGCGEGWYDRAVADAFAAANRPVQLAGFDIAKPAVRMAAKALPGMQYAVASSFGIPMADGWADVVLNIFSPMARQEFLRVLRPGGRLIYAVPGPRHLFGMKQVLYQNPYENPVQPVEYEGFRQIGEVAVADTITVPQQHTAALFAMTPYYWKTPRDGAERLAACESLQTEIEFRFVVYEKL